MNDLVRVYPIRTTRKEWSIPIYCYHHCNTRCSQIYILDEENPPTIRYTLVDNPNYKNGKCNRHNKLEKTSIDLSTFQYDNPLGCTGPLYEPNEIVIPDTYISVSINYPLSTCVNVTILAPTSNGFTLTELINSIKMVYQYIYEEEERTSTPRLYKIKQHCTNCSDKKPQDYVKDPPKMNKLSECSICYNDYSQQPPGQLACNHNFHKECINKWLNSSPTCPLCRYSILKCDTCKGVGFIYYDYNGTVIPVEQRGYILNRNHTNGIFGIYGHDLDDLAIEFMHYDRISKRLNLIIGS